MSSGLINTIDHCCQPCILIETYVDAGNDDFDWHGEKEENPLDCFQAYCQR
jgi:hypothetical protein